jgi:hypothetical protein
MINLNRIWKELSIESKSEERHGTLQRSVSRESGLKIGYDTNDNKKLLLLNIDNPEDINDSHFPQWEGTSIEKKKIGPESYAIALKLLDDDYISIFNALIRDLHENIKNSKSNHEAITCFANALYKWYEFFKKYGTKVLSENAQRGIYGELYFLKEHLINNSEAIIALNAWKGHEMKHHDYSFPNGVLEVKTTIRKAHKKVTISNEKQLDNTGFPHLFLYCITLNMDSNNGESLVELVHGLEDYFSKYPNAATIFNNFLSNTGYLKDHEKYYQGNKYIFKNEFLFEVDDNFPKITDPPEGVGDVKYSLMIGSCLEHQVEIDPSIKKLL